MKQSTIKKYLNLLNSVRESGVTLRTYCIQNKLNYHGVCQMISHLKKVNNGKSNDINTLLDLYDIVVGKKVVEENVETDDAAETSYLRDEEGKIQYYCYQIYRQDKLPLTGKFTREEMNSIYRLYSYYGNALTQRVISRHFPELSLVDFRRILRAFNITKASAPFAPHYFEEYSEEELRKMQLREKESSFLRKAEADVIKNNEKLLKKYAQENIDLREQLKKAQFTVDLKNIVPCKIETNNTSDKTINLYLADMHIGAAVVSGSLYDENVNYGPDEIIRRLQGVLGKLTDLGPFNKINLVLMGDNIDCCGVYGKTARLDHDMPENMDPREQANQFISIIKWFVESLYVSFKSDIEIFSVPCGNHSGNYEYVCNKALMSTLNVAFPNIKTTLWEEFYGLFEVNGLRFLPCHGKDPQFMKKPMPLNIDDKTQLMLYEWLDSKHIYGDNIHFIKGDLHSNSLSSCKKLTYRNVLSLFGSSDYSNYNYSRNSYGMSYDLIVGTNLMRGTIENV